ncbi:MAG: electron transfer flavoprotein subunit alpha/FixB family protein [Deltaproteobacteria bacterium]
MSVLVFAEQREGQLRKAAKEAVSAGRIIADQIGARLSVLLAGSSLSALVPEVRRYGAHSAFLAEDPALGIYRTEAYADILELVVKEVRPRLVLMAHTVLARDIAPRVAQRLEAGLVSDCVEMSHSDGALLFTRPVYAGKALARMSITTPVQMVTLRPNAFAMKEFPGTAEVRNVEIPAVSDRMISVHLDLSDGQGPELTEAEIIVSGGRGLGDQTGFDILRELARLLGAALGASRSAVDAGWASHQMQVGQTGNVVSPKLYIALGISGAIQHIAGMGTSKCIVAVNKDPEANMVRIADYSIVGDLYEIVPMMIHELKNKKTQS